MGYIIEKGIKMKKYELTDEVIEHFGHKLYRIKALVDLPKVNKGDLGGFIEKEENLSHEADCWVCEEAKVYGNAHVGGYAKVCGVAWVFDNAAIYENAWVGGRTRIYEDARVYEWARITGDAIIRGEAGIRGFAKVAESAVVFGSARISGGAQVGGTVLISGEAVVSGSALIIDLEAEEMKKRILDSPLNVKIDIHNALMEGKEAEGSIIRSQEDFREFLNKFSEAYGIIKVFWASRTMEVDRYSEYFLFKGPISAKGFTRVEIEDELDLKGIEEVVALGEDHPIYPKLSGYVKGYLRILRRRLKTKEY